MGAPPIGFGDIPIGNHHFEVRTVCFREGICFFFLGGGAFWPGFCKTMIDFSMKGPEKFHQDFVLNVRNGILNVSNQSTLQGTNISYPIKKSLLSPWFSKLPEKTGGSHVFYRSEWRVYFCFFNGVFSLTPFARGRCWHLHHDNAPWRVGWFVGFFGKEMGRKWLVSCSSKEMSEASCSTFVCLNIRGLPQACCYLYMLKSKIYCSQNLEGRSRMKKILIFCARDGFKAGQHTVDGWNPAPPGIYNLYNTL